jgi:hypothetical protein
MLSTRFTPALLAATIIITTGACTRTSSSAKAPPADTAFTNMQDRGKMAMGVDQYTSSHHFESTPDGGRIELQRDTVDSLGIAQIRAHMRLIQHAFEAGDFSTPAFVHMKDMPGTAIMSAKRGVIKYRYADLPRGAEVRISTGDPEALKAIGEFLAAQQMEHHSH